jgi:WD40 repeat protein
VGTGSATLKVSFNSWRGTLVASTTHVVPVLPRKAGIKEEPVASNLVASLVHPDRSASVWTVEFSPDGSKLFTAGYPSGIVQIWDLAQQKEVRRIDTPPGLRGTGAYALLTPDWKTLYVPVEKQSLHRSERKGKLVTQVAYTGSIRVWDIASGQEKTPLKLPVGTAPGNTKLSPSGRYLIWPERASYDTAGPRPSDVTRVQDLQSGLKWKLNTEASSYALAPDERTVVAGVIKTKTTQPSIKLLDLVNGKELARLELPHDDRYFSIGPISPDGKIVWVGFQSKPGAPFESWLLDAKTLALRGKLIGKAKPGVALWGGGIFNGDGTKLLMNGQGNVLIWSLATQRLESTIAFSAVAGQVRRPVLSPDGNLMAVAWMPPVDPEIAGDTNPDPQDLPQPRITLIDLAGKRPQRELVAPHGFLGGVAFSPDGKTLAFGSAGAVHLFDLTK